MRRGETLSIDDARVAEDANSGALIGFCFVQKRELLVPDDMYIALIAVSAAYRRRRLPDGTRLGSFLLRDALVRIKMLCGPPMPPVWALISPENVASHSLFADWGFDYIASEGTGRAYDIRYRERGRGVVPTAT